MQRSAAAGPAGFPPALPPMLALPGPPPTGPGWAYEFKWDGMRATCGTAGGRVRVLSRAMRDVTAAFPELAEAGALLGERRTLLDGEIVAPDSAGRPSFALLQRRMNVQVPDPALRQAVPVLYHVFDLLYLDDRPTTDLPYRRRRELLAGLGLTGGVVKVPPHFVDVDGEDVLEAARAYGLEGVVAKRLDSPYQPGRRSPGWVKVPLLQTQEVTVIGHTPGAGRRAGTIGSLLLAVPDATGRLVYAGRVGTGFTDDALRALQQRLEPLRVDEPPVPGVPREHARHARWVSPVLVGEVSYRNWTPDGQLRHASWRGLRPDLPESWRATRPVVRGASVVEGAMQTPDGRWRVEVVREGDARRYRLVRRGDGCDGNVVEDLSLADVERLLERAGVDIRTMREVPAA